MNGKISQIMGAVVDVSFSKGNLPKILNALEIEHNENNFKKTDFDKLSKDRNVIIKGIGIWFF